jgi:hypothetical protein
MELAGAEATPFTQATMNGHADSGAVMDDPDEDVNAPPAAFPAAGTYDPSYMLGGSVDTPPSTRDQGSHSFAEGDIPIGTASFNPKLSCVGARVSRSCRALLLFSAYARRQRSHWLRAPFARLPLPTVSGRTRRHPSARRGKRPRQRGRPR